ncbi:S-layer homology domain-containing protein [Agathobaculum sp.]|uniref:S-layer homology domain-containing protein n=1 Tax=Agathobaculum sp. TaxID=2048138 RepID=UPI003AB3779E
MFAGAAFTDSADFKVKTEVVDTLVQLGVINGYTDGSFKPNDTVTRAEMAKMIYVLRTGNSDASAYNNDKTTFTDIKGHWAAGYIKYCQSLGIIAGVSATQFKPDTNVTAQEAAKMLLVTLGYDATKAGLVGINWASKTNALADENGLLDDVTTSFTGPCPRQYAAQLMYNAIDAATVVWRDDAYTNVTLLGEDNQTVGEKYMGLAKKAASEGILKSVKKEDGKDTFRVSVYINDKDVSFTKVANDYSALLGQKVHVLYKDGQKDKVYGIYATDENTAVTALVDDVDDIDKTVGKVKIDGTSYKTETANAKDLPVYVTPEMDKFTKATTLKDLASKFPYFTATFVDYNDNDKLDYAIVTPFVPAQIDNLSTSSITVSALDVNTSDYGVVALENTAPKLEDVDLYEKAAEDDYVAVVNAENSVTGNTIITKMNTVSGKVSAIRNGGSDAKVDSTWYSIVADETVDNNDEYDFATIGKFVFATDATATSVSASNILYVGDVAAKNSGVSKGVEADVYFADGTSKTVTLTKLDGVKFYENSTWNSSYVTSGAVDNTKLENALKGQMFKFTKKSDTEYEIKALTIGSYDKLYPNKAGRIDEGKFTEGTYSGTTFTAAGGNNFRMADDAVVFVTEKNGDVSVKTGKSVNNWNTATKVTKASALTKKTNGFQYAKIACLTIATDIPSSSDYLYGYVVSKIDEIDNDGIKYQFTIWNGEKEVTLTTEDDKGVKKGSFVAYSIDGDLVDIELTVKNVKDHAVAISAYDADDISFSDGKTYEIDDDCVVIGVNTEDTEGVAGTKLATAKEKTKDAGDYWKNAVYFVDGGKVTAVFVDTQGKMYDKSSNAFLHI